MIDHALPALFVIAVWWASTGVVLRVVWLPPATHRVSIVVAAILALAGLGGIVWSRPLSEPLAAYVGFAGAMAIWGFHELLFLLGKITGSRRIGRDPAGSRFVQATLAIIHHELALAATLVVLAAVSWGAPNHVARDTFFVLWIMRLSSKLNLFLGVPNVTEKFVPQHLRYLVTYFRRARMNALMPFSIVVGCASVALWVSGAVEAGSPFVRTWNLLLGSLMALAVIEHIFMTLPVNEARLWTWLIRRSGPRQPLEKTPVSLP